MEALYRILEGFCFSPAELVLTSLFHFQEKVHRKSLTRAESTPLLFLRLLCQVLEHIGFPTEPRLERHHDCEALLTVDRRQTKPRAFHLPPPEPAEDQPTTDLPTKEQPAPTVHTEEHQVPASSIPALATTAPLPPAPASSVPPKPPNPNTTAHVDAVGSSTSAPPPQHIGIYTRDFPVIMDAVHTFSATSTSFATAHEALAKRMTRIEVALAHNQAILMQIQSHLSLPPISPPVPAQASSAPL